MHKRRAITLTCALLFVATAGQATSLALTRLLNEARADTGLARYFALSPDQRPRNRALLVQGTSHRAVLGRWLDVALRNPTARRDVSDRLRTSAPTELLQQLRDSSFVRATPGYTSIASDLRRWGANLDRQFLAGNSELLPSGRGVAVSGRTEAWVMVARAVLISMLEGAAGSAGTEPGAADSAMNEAIAGLEGAFAGAASCIDAASASLEACFQTATDEEAILTCKAAYLKAWTECLSL